MWFWPAVQGLCVFDLDIPPILCGYVFGPLVLAMLINNACDTGLTFDKHTKCSSRSVGSVLDIPSSWSNAALRDPAKTFSTPPAMLLWELAVHRLHCRLQSIHLYGLDVLHLCLKI